MRKGFRWNRKGISTVIATIIIVAIAIVMAIAVAYWAMGIGTSFTRFEKIQITSAYAPNDQTITMMVKNSGTATATLDNSTVLANGQPLPAADVAFSVPAESGALLNGAGNLMTMPSGSTGNVTVSLPSTLQTPQLTVELILQSAAGNQYPCVVVLP